MIRIMQSGEVDASELISCQVEQNMEIDARVLAILSEVRERGDEAVLALTRQLDGATLDALELPAREIDKAYAAMDADFLQTLEMAAENIRAFHAKQVRNNFIISETEGVLLGQRVTPLARAGLYVPGGTALYPSTVLMDAIPAKLAGVPEVVMATPPRPDGSVDAGVLAAARVAGVSRVFRMGGAQAIGAMAYGTKSVPRVDKIVGPGNIYVATAKRLVYGLVDIDMVAGPSEILIIADETCNPAHIAADLLSQAEHDRLASSLLVTTSQALAEAVRQALEEQIPRLPRADICRESIDKNGRIIVAESLAGAVAISNQIAPEHLELCVEDPFSLLPAVRNAGSIFLGKNAPEALGDYFAGPNHTLPTSGTARFSSPLSVDDFVKKSSFIYYTKEALGKVRARVVDFATREGLAAHAESVAIRFREA
ncbi:MAG: histidinol dehydrogenase [Firmicutes bacterium]|nr:histidinol dehydrogenase [Bacillota bacterium]